MKKIIALLIIFGSFILGLLISKILVKYGIPILRKYRDKGGTQMLSQNVIDALLEEKEKLNVRKESLSQDYTKHKKILDDIINLQTDIDLRIRAINNIISFKG